MPRCGSGLEELRSRIRVEGLGLRVPGFGFERLGFGV